MHTWAVYTPVKDELRLKEWITYYTNMGVDLFIVLDDFSKIPVESYFEELGVLNYEIIHPATPNWNYSTLTQSTQGSYSRTLAITEHVLPICKKYNIEYLLQVDSDEFLFLNAFSDMRDLINHYAPFDELKINWLLFDHNNIKDSEGLSLIKLFTRSQLYLNIYTKTFTKVSSIQGGLNAHAFQLQNNSVRKNIFNNVIPPGMCVPFPHEYINKVCYKNCPVFVAHYVYKSIRDFVEKKCCRIDGNFRFIFLNHPVSRVNIIKFHTENTNKIIDYIYEVVQPQSPAQTDIINEMEANCELLSLFKPCYLKYYKMYNCKVIISRRRFRFPTTFFDYVENLSLVNHIAK